MAIDQSRSKEKALSTKWQRRQTIAFPYLQQSAYLNLTYICGKFNKFSFGFDKM